MDEVEREVDQEIVALEDEIADTYNQVDVVLEGSTTSIQNSMGGIKNLVETTQDDITRNDDLTNNVADHIDDVMDTNTNKINNIIDNNINDATENVTNEIGDLVDSAKLNGHVVQKKLGEAIEESLNKINDGIPSFNG